MLVFLGPDAVAQDSQNSHGLRRISLAQLEDKIRGGWAGQMVGVSYGFPTEFEYRERIAPLDELPVWKSSMLAEALNQDDLYVDMSFAEVLDKKGLDATTQDFGDHFKQTKYPLWHANLAARRALKRGVPAALSGTPSHNAHFNDIDFQIEADFIGLMSPGLPQESNRLSLTAGQVTNFGEGIYGGMFIAAMYAAAFFESDPPRIVAAGLAALPKNSAYAGVITDVLAWWRLNPENWENVWQQIQDKWNTGEMCPEGALEPFNIDAKLNGAYVALGLLYGRGDFERTMMIATRAGQDSDCNPASALGILGVAQGFDAIPERLTAGLAAIADTPFSYTPYSFNTIVASTLARAKALAVRAGGRLDKDVLWVKMQTPQPAVLMPQPRIGQAVEHIRFDDSRWRWSGAWQTENTPIWRYQIANRRSETAGATATIRFQGSGVIVTGLFLPDGGLLDVYLDDVFAATVDVYPDEDQAKFGEAIWHRFDLPDQPHELRLVVKGEPYSQSCGALVSLTGLKVFR